MNLSLSTIAQAVFTKLISPFYSKFTLENGMVIANSNTLMSYLFYKESLGLGKYECGVIDLLGHFVTNAGLIIDVGANEGYFSLQLSRMYPKSIILAIEANPSTYSCLGKNLQLNNINNVSPLNLAASTFDHDEITLHVASRYYRSHARVTKYSSKVNGEVIKVATRKIDSVVEEYGQVLPTSLIKIDVEGHEREVLDGATTTIRTCLPVLLVECQEQQTLSYLYEKFFGTYYIFEVSRNALVPNPKSVYPGMNIIMIPLNA